MRTLVATLALAGGGLSAPAMGAAQTSTHLVVVVGLGGGAEYREEFLDQALTLRTAAVEGYGVPAEQVILLAEDPGMDAAIRARSSADEVRAALQGLADRVGPGDRVLIVLIGHGAFRGDEAMFNLPGPDLTAQDFAALLGGLDGADVALVNAASASGPFVPALAAPGRTVITATRTGRERNETRFGRFFADAFADGEADLDRNGAVSLLEAFTWARRETARYYDEEGLLMTEHAVLDDDGDGEGTDEPGVDTSDGRVAAVFTLGTAGARSTVVDGQARPVPSDSTLARLYRERADLESRVADLRRRQGSLDPAEYERALEGLLVELALKSREIRDREGGGR